VTSQNVFKFSPLHMAIYHACVSLPLRVLQKIVACYLRLLNSESIDCALALLDAGANIEAPDQNGWTALHIAASKGNDAIVDLLMSRGAFINATTVSNQTPLLMAACNGHIAVVRRLMNASTYISYRNCFSTGPLISDSLSKRPTRRFESRQATNRR
jgi:ankyrin repeat protein